MDKRNDEIQRPSLEQIDRELQRLEGGQDSKKVILSALGTLTVFAALAVLVATLLLPVVRVNRGSMTPTLWDGDVIVFLEVGTIHKGDIVAFYYNNQILIKRVIATAGEWVDIDPNGVVSIDGKPLQEPYLGDQSLGECTIPMPFQVPDGKFFVMGDHRSTSVDSRAKEIGPVGQDQIVGKAILRIWPFSRIGFIT